MLTPLFRVGLRQKARKAVYPWRDWTSGTDEDSAVVPTSPGGLDDLPVKGQSSNFPPVAIGNGNRNSDVKFAFSGRRYFDRFTRSDVSYPNLVALWFAEARGPTTRYGITRLIMRNSSALIIGLQVVSSEQSDETTRDSTRSSIPWYRKTRKRCSIRPSDNSS